LHYDSVYRLPFLLFSPLLSVSPSLWPQLSQEAVVDEKINTFTCTIDTLLLRTYTVKGEFDICLVQSLPSRISQDMGLEHLDRGGMEYGNV
jgi:hypothetical protein